MNLQEECLATLDGHDMAQAMMSNTHWDDFVPSCASDAIRAVLAIPNSPHLADEGPRRAVGVDCYNAALGIVREMIAEKLGL